MNEFTRKLLITILVLIIFIICVTLVITGQRETGAPGLFRQLTGLAGLVVLLWLYNRQYK